MDSEASEDAERFALP